MSDFNALNPIRKAEIIHRRLFGKIKDYLVTYPDDGDETISDLTADVDSSFNKILTRCKYSPLDFNGETKLSDLAENRINIPTLTEMGGILTVKQTIHQNSTELFKIETHTGGHVIISSDSIPNTGVTELVTQHSHKNFEDVSSSKLVDVYNNSSQFGNHLGEFTTYTALRDISNGAICMTELSNNKVYAVMTDPARNSLSGNAVKYLIGVALEDAAPEENVRILSNGYCTVRGDFLIQVTEDADGLAQGQISLGKETNGNVYGTDASGIIFTDSGGTTNNYTPEENLFITFDAGINRTIDLSINALFTEHGYSSLYDRLGFQVSEDGKIWENADISGLIQTRETELLPPWPPGGTGTAKNGSVRSRDIEGHGWIFPERNEFDEPNSLFVTRMDHSGNPLESYGPTYMSQIKKSFDDNMKRYIRFYFRSDRSGDFIGWNILVKSSSGAPAFENSVVANSILYLSQSDVGKATAFTGSGIRLGYSVIDSSSNNIGDFTYARIQDTNN